MIIDFTKNKEVLSEDYLKAVGEWSKWLLGRMFGSDTQMVGTMSPAQALSYIKEEDKEGSDQKVNFVIRGKYRDIKAYAQALGRERDYILAAAKYEDNHPVVAKAKAELDQATNHFERLTGILWPFK